MHRSKTMYGVTSLLQANVRTLRWWPMPSMTAPMVRQCSHWAHSWRTAVSQALGSMALWRPCVWERGAGWDPGWVVHVSFLSCNMYVWCVHRCRWCVWKFILYVHTCMWYVLIFMCYILRCTRYMSKFMWTVCAQVGVICVLGHVIGLKVQVIFVQVNVICAQVHVICVQIHVIFVQVNVICAQVHVICVQIHVIFV